MTIDDDKNQLGDIFSLAFSFKTAPEYRLFSETYTVQNTCT